MTPSSSHPAKEFYAGPRRASISAPFIVGPSRVPCAGESKATFLSQALRPLRLLLQRWHLLSLDAPSIATLWTALIARDAGLHLPAVSLIAMFLAVWTLYAADRLLDARPLRNASLGGRDLRHAVDLEPRHHFHHRHRAGFLVALAGITIVLGALLPSLPMAALRLDLLLGALLVSYFIMIHALDGARLPKEIAVGLFFSAAVFIPTIARRPDLRLELAPTALLFATLCSLNCIAIYRWEHASLLQTQKHLLATQLSRPHVVTSWAIAHLLPISYGLIVVATTAATRVGPGRLDCLAIALAAALLLLLHQRRDRLSPVTLRALADLALATPLVLWPVTRVLHRL